MGGDGAAREDRGFLEGRGWLRIPRDASPPAAMGPPSGFGPPVMDLPAGGNGPPRSFGPERQGPPGPFGPPGGAMPEGFGPEHVHRPRVRLMHGDTDRDGSLTRDEFLALGRRWFDEWDVGKSGQLDEDGVRCGSQQDFCTSTRIWAVHPAGGVPAGPPRMSFLGPQGKRNGIMSVMGIDFPSVRADLTFEGQEFADISVRYKGNGTFLQSRGSLKRSLKIDLNDDHPGRNLFGVDKLNLHCNVTDASSMNEVLAYRLYRDASIPALRTAFARVYITVPGQFDREYLGLYSLVENPDNDFAKDRFGTKQGAIFKPVAPEMFEDMGSDWSAYEQAYDPKTSVSTKETQRVIDFCQLVSHADDAEFAQKLPEYLDLEQFARYMAVTVWLSAFDSPLAMGQNYLVYLHPETNRFLFLPWDLDHAFGQFYPIGTQEQRETLSIRKPWVGENRFLARVFAVDAFRDKYFERIKEMHTTLCQPERLTAQVDQLAEAIRPAVKDESADRFSRFDQAVRGEAVDPAGFGGAGPGGPGFGGPGFGGPGFGGPGFGGPGFGGPGFGGPGPQFMDSMRVKPIKGFVVARAASVQSQLDGSATGTEVAGMGMAGPGGRPSGPLPGPGSDAFGPGMFLGPVFMRAMDQDESGDTTREECEECFARWHEQWSGADGKLSPAALRDGLNGALSPFGPGGPGGNE